MKPSVILDLLRENKGAYFSGEEISKKLNVAHQNVTKRLLAAGWQQFKEASELLREILAKAAES